MNANPGIRINIPGMEKWIHIPGLMFAQNTERMAHIIKMNNKQTPKLYSTKRLCSAYEMFNKYCESYTIV